jgi:hypothetical protein
MANTSTAARSRKGAVRPQCVQRNTLAILSTSNETRVVRVIGRAADVFYDWKVEVLGSPAWMVDARSKAPSFTNLGFVRAADLHVIGDEVEVCHA